MHTVRLVCIANQSNDSKEFYQNLNRETFQSTYQHAKSLCKEVPHADFLLSLEDEWDAYINHELQSLTDCIFYLLGLQEHRRVEGLGSRLVKQEISIYKILIFIHLSSCNDLASHQKEKRGPCLIFLYKKSSLPGPIA